MWHDGESKPSILSFSTLTISFKTKQKKANKNICGSRKGKRMELKQITGRAVLLRVFMDFKSGTHEFCESFVLCNISVCHNFEGKMLLYNNCEAEIVYLRYCETMMFCIMDQCSYYTGVL